MNIYHFRVKENDMTNVKFKTRREMALENDIALAAPILHELRQYFLNIEADMIGTPSSLWASEKRLKIELVMATLDISFVVGDIDNTYHE